MKATKGDFHERYADAAPAPPSDRSTGLVFAGVAALIAVLSRANPAIAVPALIASLAFALASWLRPGLLAPLNRAWFRLSLLLNRVVSPLVMLLLYALAIVPAGLLMQRLRDPLGASRAPGSATYWSARGSEAAPGSMINQF